MAESDPTPTPEGAWSGSSCSLSPKMAPGDVTMTSDPSISPTGGPPGDTTAADTLLIRTPRGAGVSGPTAPTGRRRHKSLGLPCGRRGCEGPPPPDPSPAGTQLGRRPKNCRQAPTTPGQWGQTEVPEEQLSRCSQGHGAERRRRKGKAGQEAPLGSALVGAPPPPRSLSLLRLLPALPCPLQGPGPSLLISCPLSLPPCP